jgi:hypothetical protein
MNRTNQFSVFDDPMQLFFWAICFCETPYYLSFNPRTQRGHTMQEVRDVDLGITPCYFIWRFDQFKLEFEVLPPLDLLGLCPFYSSVPFSKVV